MNDKIKSTDEFKTNIQRHCQKAENHLSRALSENYEKYKPKKATKELDENEWHSQDSMFINTLATQVSL